MNTNRIITPLLFAAALVAGCYNPKIRSGSLKCNMDFSADYECPEGHRCVNGYCYKNGTDAGASDVPVDKTQPTDVPVDKHEAGSETGPDLGMCVTSVAGCTPDTAGKCDPVCQTGCGCKEKCSVVTSGPTSGSLTCVVPGGTVRAKEGRACDFYFDGTPNQSDNCDPGLICLHDACGDVCARFCKTNADCPNSLCNRALPGGAKVCDVSTVECNPVKTPNWMTGCPGATQNCYLSASVMDRTVCDCSNGSQGLLGSCSTSRDCFGGLVCADPSGAGLDLRCRQVCNLGATNGCSPGFTCKAHLDSKKYGYCN